MFVAASHKNLEALILSPLNTSESNELSLDLLILYTNQ